MAEQDKRTESGNLGGITKTADSALREDEPGANPTPAVSPAAETPSAGPSAPFRNKPHAPSSKPPQDKDALADEGTAEDESALESLGRAIGAPLSGEAAEKEPRR